MAGTQRLWFLLLCSSLWFFRRSSRTGVEASTSVLNPEALPEMVSRVQLYSTPSGYSYYMHLENQMNPPLSSLLSSSTESYPFKILVDTGTAFYVLKQPENAAAFNSLSSSTSSLSEVECLYLIIDTTHANFTGTPSNSRKCLQSVRSTAANVSMEVFPSGSLIYSFVRSFLHSFIPSFLPCFLVSLFPCFLVSLFPCLIV